MKNGFSLAELLIVVVIMGILGGIALPNFQKTVEKAKVNQAASYLRAIRTGEMLFRAGNETGTYTNCADETAIQNSLKVALTTDNWNFLVTEANTTHFKAQANSKGGLGSLWIIANGSFDATAGSTAKKFVPTA